MGLYFVTLALPFLECYSYFLLAVRTIVFAQFSPKFYLKKIFIYIGRKVVFLFKILM